MNLQTVMTKRRVYFSRSDAELKALVKQQAKENRRLYRLQNPSRHERWVIPLIIALGSIAWIYLPSLLA